MTGREAIPLALKSVGEGGARGFVPLGEVADVRVVEGPPMLRDEDGSLVGYVYVDIDTERDVGGYVNAAKAAVNDAVAAGKLTLAPGTMPMWGGSADRMTASTLAASSAELA